jgi:predicted nucleic acid-binding protein
MPTKDRIFLDTNVVVYSLYDQSPKQEISISLLRKNPCISTQVIMESVNVCIRKLKLSKEKAFENATYLLKSCEIITITAPILTNAFSISLQYQLSHWDSLIIASAIEAGCTTLYSEDLQHNQLIENKLQIINPFTSQTFEGSTAI